MEKNMYSRPLSLRSMKINDKFWKQEMEVVRKEVIPYQWAALNDQVEGAAPSFCMRNFKVAGKQNIPGFRFFQMDRSSRLFSDPASGS